MRELSPAAPVSLGVLEITCLTFHLSLFLPDIIYLFTSPPLPLFFLLSILVRLLPLAKRVKYSSLYILGIILKACVDVHLTCI